jgi:hypothetical protein
MSLPRIVPLTTLGNLLRSPAQSLVEHVITITGSQCYWTQYIFGGLCPKEIEEKNRAFLSRTQLEYVRYRRRVDINKRTNEGIHGRGN